MQGFSDTALQMTQPLRWPSQHINASLMERNGYRINGCRQARDRCNVQINAQIAQHSPRKQKGRNKWTPIRTRQRRNHNFSHAKATVLKREGHQTGLAVREVANTSQAGHHIKNLGGKKLRSLNTKSGHLDPARMTQEGCETTAQNVKRSVPAESPKSIKRDLLRLNIGN
jgi:hypothetical protein